MFSRGVFGCMKDCQKGKENIIPFVLIFNGYSVIDTPKRAKFTIRQEG